MSQLSADKSHINNGFVYNNIGVTIGMSCVKYSGSYGAILFGTRRIHASMVDNDTAVAFSVAHTALYY